MDIFEWKRNKKKNIFNGGIMIYVSEGEAISIINSLTNQMVNESSNSGRLETYLKDGRNFSIAVNAKKSEGG
jgi:hypothetical protein